MIDWLKELQHLQLPGSRDRGPAAMGRPEPVVLFAQTILHSQLDEYVDEVRFPSSPFLVPSAICSGILPLLA